MALWSLWACKETAYKVLNKSLRIISFLPQYWPVQLRRAGEMIREGKVVIPGGDKVFVQLYSSEEYVHCIGAADPASLHKIIWGIDPVTVNGRGENIDPSPFVRQCLCRKLADIYKLDLGKMEIRRSKKGNELQPPLLYYEDKLAPFDVSLSHDGRFAAYAFIQQND